LKTNRLLAGTLALVLIAGLTILPSFPNVAGHGTVDQSFDGPTNTFNVGTSLPTVPSLVGQSFTPTKSILAGVDLFFQDNIRDGSSTATVTINLRDGSINGAILGTTSKAVTSAFGGLQSPQEVHFDFIPPITNLTPGNLYVIEMQSNISPSFTPVGRQDVLPANPYAGGDRITGGNVSPESDHAFRTYFTTLQVGGQLLQIDSTALLLAGLQTSAIWMLPILAGAAGVGAYYIKTRMNKE